MRRNNFTPRARPHHGRAPHSLHALSESRATQAMQASMAGLPTPQAQRKVFNCIADVTAMVAGAKPSTRDGIRKWVSQGAIRLFVPLHTLDELKRLTKGSERANLDAAEALVWLDTVTSDDAIQGRVQIEGADEAYPTWAEVETFLLPETLLSMEYSDSDDDASEFGEDLESSFTHLDASDRTSVSSSDDPPPKPPLFLRPAGVSTAAAAQTTTNTNGDGAKVPAPPMRSAARPRPEKSPRRAIPSSLHSLFNHIMWRINKESNPDAALESFILLTNDPLKQMIAQKFGIRAKRLEQLRDAVAREDREYRNHLILNKIEAGEPITPLVPREGTSTSDESKATEPKASEGIKSNQASDVDSSDEDVVLIKRAPRGPLAQAQAQAPTTTSQRVFDPNDFGRANSHPTPQTKTPPPAHPQALPQRGRGGRGRGAFVGAPRGGRGGGGIAPTRGRGGFVPRGSYVAPNPPFRPPPQPRANPDPNALLNPDSFDRPSPRVASTRGGRRQLWEPN